MKISGMAVMIGALILLVLPGALYNNYSNSDLVVAQGSFTLTCPGLPDVTCQSSTAVACQVTPTVCSLSGSSISFLSGSSPFTQLIQGNIFALFTNLNGNPSSGAGSVSSWSGTHGPFDLTGNSVYYSADCQGNVASGGSQQHFAVSKCTQTATDNSNVTYANTATWTNWNTNWNTSVTLHFFQLGNSSFNSGCNWIAQINYTALSNGPGFTYYGCDINQSSHGTQSPPTLPTRRHWGLLLAYPVQNGAITGCSINCHLYMYAQLENWYTENCILNFNIGPYSSAQCSQFSSGFKGITIPGTTNTIVPNSFGGLIFSFILGAVLLVLGLGLSIGVGGGVSLGSNPQGSKLAQILGIGLILWSFLYSEFSSWFTSGFLPYGFDGSFGIVSIAITGSFWVGVLAQATLGANSE